MKCPKCEFGNHEGAEFCGECGHALRLEMMSPIPIDTLLPKWAKRVSTEFGGRDPLGLSRVSQNITEFLLTGIITTTYRARYYSFYCWALWHIAQVDKPRRYQDFVDALRRRDAAVALASAQGNPDSAGLVGIEATQRRLQSAAEEINCDFQILPSNPSGGYGQIYAGSLYGLGLTFRPEDGIDRVVEGKGEALAKAFHSVVQSTPYVKNRLFEKKSFPLSELEKSKARLGIDGIREPFASQERTLLVDVFFGLSDKAPGERTILRSHTLAQILFLIHEYERNGHPANNSDSDWYLVYSPHYYDKLWATINSGLR